MTTNFFKLYKSLE